MALRRMYDANWANANQCELAPNMREHHGRNDMWTEAIKRKRRTEVILIFRDILLSMFRVPRLCRITGQHDWAVTSRLSVFAFALRI